MKQWKGFDNIKQKRLQLTSHWRTKGYKPNAAKLNGRRKEKTEFSPFFA